MIGIRFANPKIQYVSLYFYSILNNIKREHKI